MKPYLVKTPSVLKLAYANCIWHINASNKSVYLTFDDGPHPEITPYVLDKLDEYNAKATFFCIGNNVAKYPSVYSEIIRRGHSVGNHTYNHVNGWHTPDLQYLTDILRAEKKIKSHMFRPPYGRLTYPQIIAIHKKFPKMKIVMWDVLSGDFDTKISALECSRNVERSTRPGSIIVFHDSEKAWERLQYALPQFLEFCKRKDWQMKKLKF